MTDRPKTMALAPHEWRALVGTTATNIYQYVSALTAAVPPDPNQIAWLHDTIDRLQMQVSAWSASGQPVQTEKTVQWSQQHDPTSFAPSEDIGSGQLVGGESTGAGLAANGSGAAAGASSPKKKRGWQKGRKRGPRKPKGNEAVQ